MSEITGLRRAGLLTLTGVYRLAEALALTGGNAMSLLRVAAKLHGDKLAIVDEHERLSYDELWRRSETVAVGLRAEFGTRHGQRVAIACRNNAAAVEAIFAVARIGADVYLINPDVSADQLLRLDESHGFDLYVHDESLAAAVVRPPIKAQSIPIYHHARTSIDGLARTARPDADLRRQRTGRIVIMTGGTTGRPKPVARTTSTRSFLALFDALVTSMDLDAYRTAYIATPIHHGFGLSALFVSIALGGTIHLTNRFEASAASRLIADNEIEVVALVPLMLQRMLANDTAALSSLRCVVSGGAPLSPTLAGQARARLGPILFNLYGTTEGGFAFLATPELLARKPESVGRPVRGVSARLSDEFDDEVAQGAVGRLELRSAWSSRQEDWIDTGDLAYTDPDGDFYLCGRVDDMIVSGGENVYPVELENALLEHPDVAAVAVIGVEDAEFGQRLRAVVAPKPGSSLEPTSLLAWLKPRVARHQMPALVEIRTELPYTSLGKLDKKALRLT